MLVNVCEIDIDISFWSNSLPKYIALLKFCFKLELISIFHDEIHFEREWVRLNWVSKLIFNSISTFGQNSFLCSIRRNILGDKTISLVPDAEFNKTWQHANTKWCRTHSTRMNFQSIDYIPYTSFIPMSTSGCVCLKWRNWYPSVKSNNRANDLQATQTHHLMNTHNPAGNSV